MQKDGTMKVLNGQLTGVALVTEPAVRSARVSEVAASEILKLKQLQRQQTQMKETKWTTLPNQ
jgi:phage head maturation protease